MFELRVEPAPPGLAALGQQVELRERPACDATAAMAPGATQAERWDRLLAITLHVDGEPIGYEALRAVPGRMLPGMIAATNQCLVMYGVMVAVDAAAPTEVPKD